MSENRLTEEELVEVFNRMFTRWGGLVGEKMQTYNQFKEIVKEHFKIQERKDNSWFCPECGCEYNLCCKEHIQRQIEEDTEVHDE